MSAQASAEAVVGSAAAGQVRVHVRGQISEPERDCAQAMIAAVLAHHRQADGARVRLTTAACGGGPALIQVSLRVCGAPARIQVAGPTLSRTIAAGASRLDRRIRILTTAWEPWPWPDPERPALGLPGEGRIVRLKSYRMRVGTPCQAAAMLDAMDYDVFLYTDAETGEDAVVYRAGPAGVQLARQRSMRPPRMPVGIPLTVNPRRTPRLTPAQATRRLAEGWLPFLFFTDEETERGSLLYRRYSGDLGLIAPKVPGQRPAP